MINNQEIHSARKSFSQSRIARLLTDIFPKWGRPADKLTPVSKVPRKPLRHMGFMLEPLEPRLLLSADISYTYCHGPPRPERGQVHGAHVSARYRAGRAGHCA